MAHPVPPFDAERTTKHLVGFLRHYGDHAGVDGAVLGVSGGVDSAVAAALAARAWGPDNVLGLLLPHKDSHPDDAEHARLVVEALGIDHRVVDITPLTDVIEATVSLMETARANAKARARMVLLYAHANSMGRLVIGTGNKSELLTGYFTKYGDGGADVYPLGDVYKTHVWDLARHLDLPDEVVTKPPSAGLWAGQTDEDELGIAYRDLDALLGALEAGLTWEEAAARTGLPAGEARRIHDRVVATEHKRTSLVVPKLGFRTPGLDWRLPRSWG